MTVVKLFNLFIKFLNEYEQNDLETGDDFLESRIDCASLTEAEVQNCARLIKHKDFLDQVRTDFFTLHRIKTANNVRISVFIFEIIFVLNKENEAEFYENLRNFKVSHKKELFQFFTDEDCLTSIALTGCKIFEDEYVLNSIIQPLLEKSEILKRFRDLLTRKIQIEKKPPTVPDHLNVLTRTGKVPMVPVNTPVIFDSFKATKVPASVYQGSNKVEQKLAVKFEKNRRRANVLLANAKGLTVKFVPRAKPNLGEAQKKFVKFKAKMPPKQEPVTAIKLNAATLLREANLLYRAQEKEVRNIDEVLKTGFVLEDYKKLEAALRRIQKQKEIEAIERKHLEGLLTFEEAILAKKRLTLLNKRKYQDFQEEREKYLLKLDEWRENEELKIKSMVKKSHEIEENARNSDKSLKERRAQEVAEIKAEAAKIAEEVAEKNRLELTKKVELIKSIKALHDLRIAENDEKADFDRGSTADLGLMCEMSLVELKERLHSLKNFMEAELEKKRKCIQEFNLKRKQMIDNVKHFIAQSRMSKAKSVPIPETKLEIQSPELDRLKKRLEETRKLRLQFQGNDDLQIDEFEFNFRGGKCMDVCVNYWINNR